MNNGIHATSDDSSISSSHHALIHNDLSVEELQHIFDSLKKTSKTPRFMHGIHFDGSNNINSGSDGNGLVSNVNLSSPARNLLYNISKARSESGLGPLEPDVITAIISIVDPKFDGKLPKKIEMQSTQPPTLTAAHSSASGLYHGHDKYFREHQLDSNIECVSSEIISPNSPTFRTSEGNAIVENVEVTVSEDITKDVRSRFTSPLRTNIKDFSATAIEEDKEFASPEGRTLNELIEKGNDLQLKVDSMQELKKELKLNLEKKRSDLKTALRHLEEVKAFRNGIRADFSESKIKLTSMKDEILNIEASLSQQKDNTVNLLNTCQQYKNDIDKFDTLTEQNVTKSVELTIEVNKLKKEWEEQSKKVQDQVDEKAKYEKDLSKTNDKITHLRQTQASIIDSAAAIDYKYSSTDAKVKDEQASLLNFSIASMLVTSSPKLRNSRILTPSARHSSFSPPPKNGSSSSFSKTRKSMIDVLSHKPSVRTLSTSASCKSRPTYTTSGRKSLGNPDSTSSFNPQVKMSRRSLSAASFPTEDTSLSSEKYSSDVIAPPPSSLLSQSIVNRASRKDLHEKYISGAVLPMTSSSAPPLAIKKRSILSCSFPSVLDDAALNCSSSSGSSTLELTIRDHHLAHTDKQLDTNSVSHSITRSPTAITTEIRKGSATAVHVGNAVARHSNTSAEFFQTLDSKFSFQSKTPPKPLMMMEPGERLNFIRTTASKACDVFFEKSNPLRPSHVTNKQNSNQSPDSRFNVEKAGTTPKRHQSTFVGRNVAGLSSVAPSRKSIFNEGNPDNAVSFTKGGEAMTVSRKSLPVNLLGNDFINLSISNSKSNRNDSTIQQTSLTKRVKVSSNEGKNNTPVPDEAKPIGRKSFILPFSRYANQPSVPRDWLPNNGNRTNREKSKMEK